MKKMGIKRIVRFLHGRKIVRKIAQRPKAVEKARAGARKAATHASIGLETSLSDTRIKDFENFAFKRGMQETFNRDLKKAKAIRAAILKRRKNR